MLMDGIVTIDKEKCRKDGACVAECPGKLLVLDKEGFPAAIKSAEELCIDCGHCVAVCQEGALDQRKIKSSSCLALKKDLVISQEQVEQLLRSRRSTRQYKAKPVEREKILRLLEIAGYAPSGHNAQPSRWIVIMDGPKVRELAGLVADWMRGVIDQQPEFAGLLRLDRVVNGWDKGYDVILRSAPHLIIGYAPMTERTAAAAIITAIAYIELAAPALGLGTCWAGYFTGACQSYEPLRKAIALPEDHSVYGAVMAGYPKARYYRIPTRKPVDVIWR
jgi:nitroreductase/NAD-dependent dihydropyrimidine dehydrogenase PreA subunit